MANPGDHTKGNEGKKIKSADGSKLTALQHMALSQTIQITGQQVFDCAKLGLNVEEAAACLGMHRSTLVRKLKDDELGGAWVMGQANIRRDLRNAQYKTAVEDRNPTMLIWMGKQFLNQRDKMDGPSSIEITDADKTVMIRWDDDLEHEYQDILALDEGSEVIDVTPDPDAGGEKQEVIEDPVG
jgi:DNA-binding protein Fis